MGVIDDLIKACKNDKNYPIKNFGDYKIEKLLGKGQQGVVLLVKNRINKQFALKFYRPTDEDPTILKKSVGRFTSEIDTLASLKHKNIVKIYTGGHAQWTRGKWDVAQGFEKFKPSTLAGGNHFLYYIMDFIEGHELTDIFPELNTNPGDKKSKPSKLTLTTGERIKYFETLIKQVSEAMIYYHKQKITHKDIKPGNIRYSIEDDNFIVVDFGFSERYDQKYKEEAIPKVEYIDLPSIEIGDYEKNDMGQFSKMLARLVGVFQGEYLNNRYSGIEHVIEKGMHRDLKSRYKDMSEFYNQIRQYFLIEGDWRFQLKLDEFLTPNLFGRFDSKLRIPISGSILLSKEIRQIIDTPEFQRLRGVRQLGPTIFVFPGANHTRFEHSLGVFSLALRYLEKLLNLAEFRNSVVPLEKSIKMTVLCALLHDIGHYPYSHWVEEIDELPNKIKLPHHEDRAKKILGSGEIKKVIKDVWGLDAEAVADLISNSSEDELINSIINSVIDVDKLDYLTRDSIHCGISYGKGIDLERLLDSLYIDTQNNKLCITEKGRSALLSILSTRNIMYQEIYWHKTVRACEAMFKRFFFEYVGEISSPNKRETAIAQIERILNYSDDEFISYLYDWSAKVSSNDKLRELMQPFAFKGRTTLYKPAYIYFDNNSKDSNITNKFFRSLFKCTYRQLVDKSNRLVDLMKKDIPSIEYGDILLETTPVKTGERYLLDGFRIFNTRKRRYDDHPPEINSLNDYLEHNKQAYIFCHPQHYKKVKEVLMKSQYFHKLIAQL